MRPAARVPRRRCRRAVDELRRRRRGPDRPVPSRWAEHTELDALCAVLGERGRCCRSSTSSTTPGSPSPASSCSPSCRGVTASRRRCRRCSTTRRSPTPRTQVMAAVERAWASGARGVAAGADPADRHQLHARPAQPHVPGHPGWWNGAVDADPAEKLAALGDPRRRRPGRRGDAVAAIARRLEPADFVVRDVALDATAASSVARSARSPPSAAPRRPSC